MAVEDRKSTVKGLYRDRIQGSLCAGVYMQEYFKARIFPHNMPDIWTRQWGHLVLEPKAGPAVVVGKLLDLSKHTSHRRAQQFIWRADARHLTCVHFSR